MRGLGNLKHQLYVVGMLALSVFAAGQHTFVKRLATSSVNGMKGALLVKNGEITTCELALISNKAAFVAANCLNFSKGTNTPDSSTKYQVVISNGNTQNIGSFSVDSVHAHPAYDPETFANNVALLKYNSNAQVEWKNYIAANPSDWNSEFYVYRSLTSNSTSSSWNTPAVVEASGGAPTGCAKVSTLFATNEVDFLCTTQTTSSSAGSGCVTPYSIVYGVHNSDLAVAGLYSHSVVVGKSLCQNTAVFNFYTVLSNYLEWGGVVAESTIYLYSADKTYLNNNNSSYVMSDHTDSPSVSGIVIGGDLNNPVSPSSTSVSSSMSSGTSSTSSTGTSASAPTSVTVPTSSPSEAAAAEKSSSSSGLISKVLIGVGVGLLVIGLIAFYFWRRHKKRKEAQTTNHTMYEVNPDLGVQNPHSSINFDPYYQGRAHLDTKIRTSYQ
ncbi:hypothetical protein GGI25_004557 [Coemansia spiralis]|uniref:Peptidase S1 domain-containing protein n=2 Tax=Coemansia TaxID=4863 RepID=A0A9W8KWI8_9FUNG|nr:hypothetical protein EDC05_004373 [Coemansia umbellata]KAJ2620653.1 hypothetical protein GGI26_004815 [Coemansia sp. RSA 1358]KAJ2673810.1 hypothetical protein GGI25_004557 [Coemansia spiralis]